MEKKKKEYLQKIDGYKSLAFATQMICRHEFEGKLYFKKDLYYKYVLKKKPNDTIISWVAPVSHFVGEEKELPTLGHNFVQEKQLSNYV